MELLYLYIQGHTHNVAHDDQSLGGTAFKVLKDAEFNFSNEYIISYDHVGGKLTLRENLEYIPGFFDENEKIRNITAIVGRNGTGKSSVLDFIKALYKTMYKDNPYTFIAIFETAAKDSKEFNIIHSDELKFEAESVPQAYRTEFNSTRKKVARNFDISAENIPSYELIFYSNLFEIKYSSVQSPLKRVDTAGFEDLSTYSLLLSDQVHKNNTETVNNINDISKIHKLMDVERQIRLKIRSDIPDRLLDFKIPRYLEMSVDKFDENEFIRSTGESYKVLVTGFNNSEKNAKGKKALFLARLHRAAYFNIFRHLVNSPVPYFAFDTISNNVFAGNNYTTENVANYIGVLANKAPSEDLSKKFYSLSDFLTGISILPDDCFVGSVHEDLFCYVDFEAEQQQKLLLNYFEFFNLSGFLFFDWKFNRYSDSDLSSGEKALFSMLARFNYLTRGPVRKDYKNILVLIDEGEQLLHPEWQRNYINILTTYFPIIFSEAESIQIIATSHSPFLISDLPRYCVIYLDKKDGITKVEHGFNKTHTFGGNIHELLTDSFFLGSSLIGEFARGKINTMLEEINQSSIITIKKSDEYTKLTQQIGEPFLREKILEIIKIKTANK